MNQAIAILERNGPMPHVRREEYEPARLWLDDSPRRQLDAVIFRRHAELDPSFVSFIRLATLLWQARIICRAHPSFVVDVINMMPPAS